MKFSSFVYHLTLKDNKITYEIIICVGVCDRPSVPILARVVVAKCSDWRTLLMLLLLPVR